MRRPSCLGSDRPPHTNYTQGNNAPGLLECQALCRFCFREALAALFFAFRATPCAVLLRKRYLPNSRSDLKPDGVNCGPIKAANPRRKRAPDGAADDPRHPAAQPCGAMSDAGGVEACQGFLCFPPVPPPRLGYAGWRAERRLADTDRTWTLGVTRARPRRARNHRDALGWQLKSVVQQKPPPLRL
jgi:hypothetical protein